MSSSSTNSTVSTEATVSIPLNDGEPVREMPLQEYANLLAAELHRVKAIVHKVPVEEIGARIEEIKVSLAMYTKLFEVLVTEHTKRLNAMEATIEELDEKCSLSE